MNRKYVEHFRSEGTVADTRRRRKRPARGAEAVGQIRRAVRDQPRRSVRGFAEGTGMSRSSVHRILSQDLNLFPYKLQLTQKLKRGDKARRLEWSHWLLSKVRRCPRFLSTLWMSDEADFHLDGNVVKQNCRFWSEENPQVTLPQEQFSAHVTVWCGVSEKGIVGPFFFEEAGHTTTVNSSRYSRMLTHFFLPNLRQRGVALHTSWFQHDGATAHTAKATMRLLKEHFKTRVISKNGAVGWPPRSPDLTVPDFFLWGFLKSTVYRTPVPSLAVLKRRIRRAIKKVPVATLQASMQSVVSRCRECVHRRGGHLDNVVFRT